MLVHEKRAKLLEKCFDDIIIFVNDVIKFAKFGSKSNCAYLLKDKPLLLKISNLAAWSPKLGNQKFKFSSKF